MSEDQGALYTLCTLAALGVALNIFLFAWHLLLLRTERGFRFIKHGLMLLDIAYALIGLSVIFILLYKDVGSSFLCNSGGFLLIFSTQECLWLLASVTVGLLLWRRGVLPDYVQRWNRVIFYLIAASQCLVLLPVSFLPYVNLEYLVSDKEYHYLCTPLRLPGEQGWALSAMVIVLDWFALVIGQVSLALLSLYFNSCRAASERQVAEYFETSAPSTERLQRMTWVALCVSSAMWLLPMLILSIVYFSVGAVAGTAPVAWALGFIVAFAILSHPLAFLIHHIVTDRLTHSKDYTAIQHNLKELTASCPSRLNHVTKLTSETSGCTTYLTQWRTPADAGGMGTLVAGVMKVYSPSPVARQQWQNMVLAAAKLGTHSHPNVVSFMWASPTNPFTFPIKSFTGDIATELSSIVCRAHYPNGTLKDFLAYRGHQLNEISLHKVTRDVASGLQFLHRHGLVHNNLSSSTIYMTYVSEKIGIRVALGGLEKSYEVSMRQHGKDESKSLQHLGRSPLLQSRTPDLFTVEDHLDFVRRLGRSKFTPDIKAFGLVILEMLVTLSEDHIAEMSTEEEIIAEVAPPLPERQHHLVEEQVITRARHSLASQTDYEECGKSFREVRRQPESVGCKKSGHHHHDHQHLQGGCTCSQKVTDVRATADTPQMRSNFSSLYGGEHQCISSDSMDSMADSAFNSKASTEDCSFSDDCKQDDGAQMYAVVNKRPREGREHIHTSPDPHHVVSSNLSTPCTDLEGRESDAGSCSSRPSSNISLRRGAHKQIITNGSFVASPRTPDSLGFQPINKIDASTSTSDFQSPKHEVHVPTPKRGVLLDMSRAEVPPTPPVRDYPLESTTPLRNTHDIQTIYEDEEMPPTEHSIRLSNAENTPHRLRIAPLKRESLAMFEKQNRRRYNYTDDNLIESIASFDSGLGSSNYEALSSVADQDSSSSVSLNTPRSRSAIYARDKAVDSFANSHNHLYTNTGSSDGRVNTSEKWDTGASSVLSCDDGISVSLDDSMNVNDTYEKLPDADEVLSQDRYHFSHIAPPSGTYTQTTRDSEQLSSFRPGKQPCKSRHDGLPCHAHCNMKSIHSDKTAFVPTSKNSTDLPPGYGDDPVQLKPKLPPKPKLPWQKSKERTESKSKNQSDSKSRSLRVAKSVNAVNDVNDISKQELPLVHRTQILRDAVMADSSTDPGPSSTSIGSKMRDRHIKGILKYDLPMDNIVTSPAPSFHSTSSLSSSPHLSPHSFLRETQSPASGRSSLGSLQLDDPLYANPGSEQAANFTDSQGIPYSTPTSGQYSALYANLSCADDEQRVKLIIDYMKSKGKLGFVSGQLVPLLVDCCKEDRSLSTDDILLRLGEVLPTASV